MTTIDDLRALPLDHQDDVAIALSDRLNPETAATLAQQLTDRLTQAAVPVSQRTWIVATRTDDEAAARVAAAISDQIDDARLIIHDPQDPDNLTFQRRIPGQRRGGIYLNHKWQSASIRIACGPPRRLVFGLTAWFNPPNQLHAEDLRASLLL